MVLSCVRPQIHQAVLLLTLSVGGIAWLTVSPELESEIHHNYTTLNTVAYLSCPVSFSEDKLVAAPVQAVEMAG